MARRRDAVLDEGLPHLVAECGGDVSRICLCGFIPAASRLPVHGMVEDSIYLHPDYLRRGIGRRLLAELIRQCELGPWRQMIAVIGDSGNTPSIPPARKCRFLPCREVSLRGLEVRSMVGYRAHSAAAGGRDQSAGRHAFVRLTKACHHQADLVVAVVLRQRIFNWP